MTDRRLRLQLDACRCSDSMLVVSDHWSLPGNFVVAAIRVSSGVALQTPRKQPSPSIKVTKELNT